MDAVLARSILSGLHNAQNVLYAGGGGDAVRALLTPDVEWHVPGENAIAGHYRGADEVIAYFERRRSFAASTFQLHPGEVLLGDSHVAVLTDGTATFDGVEHRWSTLGLYRLRGELIAACRLLALDQGEFDRIWSDRKVY